MESITISVPRDSCSNCGKPCFLPIHFNKYEKPPILSESLSHSPDTLKGLNVLELLKGAEDDIAILNDEIGRLGKIMMGLEARRDETMAFADLYRLSLPPVLRIPLDILGEIFRLYAENLGPIDVLAPPKITSSIWTLAGVCKSWMIAANAIPAIWSALKLSPNGETIEDRALERLQSCLIRSRDHPLSFTLDFNAPVGENIWKPLASECHRWREVKLDNRSHNLALLNIPKSHFPQLRSLDLKNVHQSSHVTDIFEDSPQLRTLHILRGSPSDWRLPWSQLQNLSFSNIFCRGNEFFTLLTQMPSLTSLTWFDSFTPEFSGSQPILLSQLRTLTWHDHYNVTNGPPYSKLTPFLSAISAPRLTALCFPDLYDVDGIFVDLVLQFCERCSCSLDKLDVGNLDTDSTFELLWRTSQITKLVFRLLHYDVIRLILPYISTLPYIPHQIRRNPPLLSLEQLCIDATGALELKGFDDTATIVTQIISVLKTRNDILTSMRLIVIKAAKCPSEIYDQVARFNSDPANWVKLELIITGITKNMAMNQQYQYL